MTIHTSHPHHVSSHHRHIPPLIQAVRDGQLTPATAAVGGPAWTPPQQALLFDSLERGWPIGSLITWSTPDSDTTKRREVLLDGHRRIAALANVLPDHHPTSGGVLRDLSSEQPRYLPAGQTTPGGRYLPVSALLNTISFLRAIRTLAISDSDPRYQIAQAAAKGLHTAVVEVIHIQHRDPTQVAELCRRLIPTRVDPILLEQLATGR